MSQTSEVCDNAAMLCQGTSLLDTNSMTTKLLAGEYLQVMWCRNNR